MIKTTELRKGNLVSHVISGIHKYYYTSESELDRINPIPITAEILLANGFVPILGDTFAKYINGVTHVLQIMSADGWYPLIVQAPEMSHETAQCIDLNKIEFIHQLQNLIYVLSGKEWEVKIKTSND